jgi:hypothetical protein
LPYLLHQARIPRHDRKFCFLFREKKFPNLRHLLFGYPHTEATPAQQLEARLIKELWRTTPWEITDYKHVSDEFQTALTTATAAGTNDIRYWETEKSALSFCGIDNLQTLKIQYINCSRIYENLCSIKKWKLDPQKKV